VQRTSAREAFSTRLLRADANPTFQVLGSGAIQLGAGGATAPDVLLSRSTAGRLKLTTGNLMVEGAATSSACLQTQVTGDAGDRIRIRADGTIFWGDGTSVAEFLSRTGAGFIGLGAADLRITTAGKGLRVTEGSNAKQGVATLVAGTVTVSNTSVTASSRIMLTGQDNNVTGALRVSARTAGTSFVITSSAAGDSGVVAYQIFEPA
jgi:hypothetical protein